MENMNLNVEEVVETQEEVERPNVSFKNVLVALGATITTGFAIKGIAQTVKDVKAKKANKVQENSEAENKVSFKNIFKKKNTEPTVTTEQVEVKEEVVEE